MNLKDLLEKRSTTVAAMRGLTESPEGNGGDLSEAQAKRFDELKTELAGLEQRVERQQSVDDAERRMTGTKITGTDNFDAQVREFSLTRAMAGAAGLNVDWGREREIGQELSRRTGQTFQGVAVPTQVFEQRVTTTAAPSAGPGSNLISTDHLGGQYIDRLRAALVVRGLGARVLTGLTGNVDIPRLNASASAGWFAENTAIPPSNQEFGKVQMTPRHVGARTEFSRNMLLQSSPDIEQIVRADFAAILAEQVDRVAIQGGGTNEPTGILATTGLDTDTSMAGTPTWAKVLELAELIENGNSEATAYLTNPAVVKLLRSTPRIASTDSRFIMEGRNTLADYPAAVTTLVPASTLIVGRWSDLLIGMWGGFDLLVNPYAESAYSKGNVQVRAIMTMDVNVRHIDSFAASTDVGVTG